MPDAPVEILLVRHSETEWNVARRWQGQGNSPVTDRGMRQIEAVATYLAAQSLRALYSSDLGRARAMARRVGEAAGCSPLYDERLRERHFGIFEGLTHEQVHARHPEAWAGYESRDPDWIVPGGESMHEAHARAVEAVESIAGSHRPGERVAVVTHGGVLAYLFRHAIGLPLGAPRRFAIPNASVNRFEWRSAGLQLVAWGGVDHLDGSATPRSD
jgi:probable phosphoglycerate mutase